MTDELESPTVLVVLAGERGDPTAEETVVRLAVWGGVDEEDDKDWPLVAVGLLA